MVLPLLGYLQLLVTGIVHGILWLFARGVPEENNHFARNIRQNHGREHHIAIDTPVCL